MKKYELTNETKNIFGKTLYRIKALIDFGSVEKGELGGFIEKEDNLNQHDNAWVYDNARVFGNAMVYGNARVFGNAWVSGKIKLEFGWCFARKRKDWNITEIENEEETLLIKDYQPTSEEPPKKMTVSEICKELGYDIEIVKEEE